MRFLICTSIKFLVIMFRDFAMLLVRYTANTEDLVKQLRKAVKQSESAKKADANEVIFHVLIKKMPGMLLL